VLQHPCQEGRAGTMLYFVHAYSNSNCVPPVGQNEEFMSLVDEEFMSLVYVL
jgi:hypothetical protein